MSTTIDAIVPKTPEQFVHVRNNEMSKVLQEVQHELEKPITRPLLNDVTRKLQCLITDDLKLQSKEWQADLPAPRQFNHRGDRTADKYYRDLCEEFNRERLAQLHRMYAKTATVLHDAMTQTTRENLEKNGKTKTHFASELSEKVDSFKLALKNICVGEVLPSVPGVPDDLTTTTQTSQDNIPLAWTPSTGYHSNSQLKVVDARPEAAQSRPAIPWAVVNPHRRLAMLESLRGLY
jgi:hypothetical protein